MIIGLDCVGSEHLFGEKGIAIANITYVDVTNLIADELHLRNTSKLVENDKGKWVNGTTLLAKFNGDLEAGNITMRENPIEKIRIKRRNLNKPEFVVLKEYPFDPNPTQLIHDDYFVSSDETYEYVVTPVDASGIEGVLTATSITPKFEGWWLIDQDNPEKYNFQFLYNLDDVSITTDEDRTEVTTFAKYPKVWYGQKRVKRGVLSGLFVKEDEGYSVRKQFEFLDEMLSQRKPFLLKNGYGRNYIVDISVPQESIMSRVKDMTKVTLNWVEVGEYND